MGMTIGKPSDGRGGSGNRLGAFGGVFTPSILTILGVILFMRAGFVIGQAGILQTLLILCLSHAITLLTALSVSAVSTNTPVSGGGALSRLPTLLMVSSIGDADLFA